MSHTPKDQRGVVDVASRGTPRHRRRYWTWPVLVFSSIVFLPSIWQSVLAQNIPDGPLNPRSSDECVAAFEPAFRQHFRGDECKKCDPIPSDGMGNWMPRYKACYAECDAVKRIRFERLTSSRQACFGRAKQAKDEDDQLRAEGLKQSRELFEKAEDLQSLLTSPSDFFARKMLPDDGLKRWLFGDASESEKARLGQEAYRYAVIQAKYGLDVAEKMKGANPVIRGIQDTALNATLSLHQNVMREFEGAMNEATAFSRDVESSYRSTGRAYSAAMLARYGVTPMQSKPGAKSKASDDGCAILNDPDKSAELMLGNQSRWMSLVKSCKQ